jgi:hypothetical protein
LIIGLVVLRLSFCIGIWDGLLAGLWLLGGG